MPLPKIPLSPLIYTEDWEIDSRLVPFAVTRHELVEVARAVAGARADAVENDPITTEGQFAYIFGTRYTRAAWRRKGWLLHREESIEAVKHPKLDWKVIYQSVDIAASLIHDPRAISGKGPGADRLIDTAQGNLFTPEQLAAGNASRLTPMNSGAWFYCVSVDGDDVRAELSLPRGLSGGNFKGFIERIFIIRDGEWPKLAVMPLPKGGPTEFEPVVTRK